MKSGELQAQKSNLVKDSQKFEIRKIRRKNIGDTLIRRAPSRDAKSNITKEPSFFTKHKGSEPGITSYRTPNSSKAEHKKPLDKIPFSQTIESKLTAHRRTKTMGVSDSKKNNYGLSENTTPGWGPSLRISIVFIYK